MTTMTRRRDGQVPAFYDDPDPDPIKWMRSDGLMSSNDVEWYTPPYITNAVLDTLGHIDLDPCADEGRSIPASEHFTETDNGLGRAWAGRVYMNPPYGRTIISWTTKLRDELWRDVTEAVALLPARVDTRWWHDLAPPVVCFIRGRIQFSGYDGAAPFPSAAVYFGGHEEAFVKAFGPLGALYRATNQSVSMHGSAALPGE